VKGGLIGMALFGVLLVATGEDIERFLTDAKREQRHPSLANAGRVVGDLARLVKDGMGLSDA
jgi:hypothetical protein